MSFSSNVILLNSKTAGKDKIYRTIQYGCKLLWYILWKYKSNKDYIEVLKKLESIMSGTRKVLRLGKTHDHIEIVLKSIHIDDYFLRYIITSCNINQALYLLLDNMLWLNSIGLVDLKKKEVLLNKWSNKFWLFSSILYLARDIHDLIGLVQKEESLKSKKYDSTNRYILNETSGAYTSNLNSNTSSLSTKRLLVQILNVLHLIVRNKRNHPLLLDTLKNIFDIFLPLANLKFVNLTPGMQGLCGLISSLISILVVWDSKYKLTP